MLFKMLRLQLMQEEKRRQAQELREFDAFCIREQLADEERKELEVLFP